MRKTTRVANALWSVTIFIYLCKLNLGYVCAKFLINLLFLCFFQDVEDIESILLEASCLSFVVDPKAFQDMSNLRLLKIYCSDPKKRPGLDLCKGLLSLPYELRLLHWEYYSLRTLPEDFDPDNLVELNMPYSQLLKLWEETKVNQNFDMLCLLTNCL